MSALVVWLWIGAQAAAATAPEPALAELLARAQHWLATFQTQLSGVVAEEAYTQDARMLGRAFTTTTAAVGHRELKSDLLLVKPTGSDGWIQFRDVFEVNGKPVRDRSERLMDLFVTPTATTKSQAERISTESARYNIGEIGRNINVPVFAMAFLLPANIHRFHFKVSSKTRPALLRDYPIANATVIEFQEDANNTIIRTTNDRDLPASGRYWIEAESGRVLMTELVASDGILTSTIDVAYGPGPGAIDVPVEMRELYEQPRRGLRVDGSATYGRFRQFQVSVDEQLAPVKKDPK